MPGRGKGIPESSWPAPLVFCLHEFLLPYKEGAGRGTPGAMGYVACGNICHCAADICCSLGGAGTLTLPKKLVKTLPCYLQAKSLKLLRHICRTGLYTYVYQLT